MFTKALMSLSLVGLLAACSSSNPEAVSHMTMMVTLNQPQAAADCFKATSPFQVNAKASTAKFLSVTPKGATAPVFQVAQAAPTLLQVTLTSTPKDKGAEDPKKNLQALQALLGELSACGRVAPPAP